MLIKDLSLVKYSFNSEALVLDRVNMEFTGRVGVLEGPPGSGKTSLLETIAGLEKGYTGYFKSGNVELMMQVPEKQFIYPTCAEELGSADTDKILEAVGLGRDILDISPWSLSAGEKKRLAIGRLSMKALESGNSYVFLLDDPFADLDRSGREILIDNLIAKSGVRVFMAISNGHELDFLRDKGIEYEKYSIRGGRIVN